MIKDENGRPSEETPVKLNKGELGLWKKFNLNGKAALTTGAARTQTEDSMLWVGHL